MKLILEKIPIDLTLRIRPPNATVTYFPLLWVTWCKTAPVTVRTVLCRLLCSQKSRLSSMLSVKRGPDRAYIRDLCLEKSDPRGSHIALPFTFTCHETRCSQTLALLWIRSCESLRVRGEIVGPRIPLKETQLPNELLLWAANAHPSPSICSSKQPLSPPPTPPQHSCIYFTPLSCILIPVMFVLSEPVCRVRAWWVFQVCPSLSCFAFIK